MRWGCGSRAGGWVVVVAVVGIATSAGCGPSGEGGAGVGGTGGGGAGRGGTGGNVGSVGSGGSAGGAGGSVGSGGSTGGSTGSAGAGGAAGDTGSGGSAIGGNAGGGAGSVGTGGVAGSVGAGGNAGGAGGNAGTGGVAGGAGTGGCAAGRGGTGGAAGAGPSNNDLDVLFLVDDSSSMRLAQTNLVSSFPAFPIGLKAAPQGAPDLHIAIISSDMGAGDGSVSGCDASGGKNGIFQYTPRGTCTATGLETGATFISDIGGVRNYAGRLENVFTCIAALGEGGCGFEQTFASVLRALGADGRGQAPAENQGFLRPDAYLAIVLVTNEDDCSATPGVTLFDTGSNTDVASILGPPSSFRCNEFGHVCNGMHPGRHAPGMDINAMVSYDSCTSNDTEHYLLSALETANRIKSLKADPSKVIVAAITGPAQPYTVTWKAPSTPDTSCGAASCPWPAIAHSCTAPLDGSFADPAVRVIELTNQFGANGIVRSICSDDLGPALQSVAQAIVGRLPL